MSSNNLLIEFVGVPGAGKSSLADSVNQLLDDQGYHTRNYTYELSHNKSPIYRSLSRLYLSLLLSFTNPKIASNVIIACLKYSANGHINRLRLAFYGLYIYRCHVQLCQDRRIDVQIIDQGIIQYSWALMDSSEIPLLQNIKDINDSGRKKIIVFVETEEKELVERLANRSGEKSRLESDLTKIRVKNSIKKYNVLKNIIEKTVCEKDSIKCIDVNTTHNSPDESAIKTLKKAEILS